MFNSHRKRLGHNGYLRLLLIGITVGTFAGQGGAFAETAKDETENSAGQTAANPVADALTESPGMLEEVWVTGWRLADLHKEIIEAEDNVYALFNTLNDDDGYDIVCKKETRAGSQIVYRVCKARAYRAAVAEASQDYVDEESETGIGHFDVDLNKRYSNKALREKMYALAVANPELLEALKKRLAAQKVYDAAREQQKE